MCQNSLAGCRCRRLDTSKACIRRVEAACMTVVACGMMKRREPKSEVSVVVAMAFGAKKLGKFVMIGLFFEGQCDF